MNKILLSISLSLLLSFFCVVNLPSVVNAENNSSGPTGNSDRSDSANDTVQKIAENKKEIKKQQEEIQKKIKLQKLDAQKKLSVAEQEKLKVAKEKYLKSCTEHQKAFKKKLNNINNMTKNNISTLETISLRVQTYVKNKNIVVQNYESLLSNINEQKQLITDLQANATEDVNLFKCGENPGDASGSVKSYKETRIQEINAVKAYKQTIKDLIIAVKNAATNKGAN